MTLTNQRVDVPVTIDESLCIQGCTLCVDVCPLDSLAINPDNGKAYMHVDECWYCGPCAARCPTGAVTVNMPFLIRCGIVEPSPYENPLSQRLISRSIICLCT